MGHRSLLGLLHNSFVNSKSYLSFPMHIIGALDLA